MTHGSARWADARTLQDLRLAKRNDDELPPFTLLLGGLGRRYDVVLGPEHSTCHLAMFGPPRSGKSSSVDVHGGDRFDSERTSEVGRPLMDASEIRQMVKYKYASTFFVVLSPDWMRSWKGRAMSDVEMAQIPAIPSPTVLAELKMQEMRSRVFSANK